MPPLSLSAVSPPTLVDTMIAVRASGANESQLEWPSTRPEVAPG
jgi:hypothetical protein